MPLTLFRLCIHPDQPCKFAPNVWKTILDLRYLEVEFRVQFVSLAQAKEDLPKQLGRSNVSIPILLVDGDGESKCIIDSYDIAQYLENKYATQTKSIFVASSKITGEALNEGLAYSRFVEQWADKCLAHEIRPCVFHTNLAEFPVEGNEDVMRSRAYYLARAGQKGYEKLVLQNQDLEWKREQYKRIRLQLNLLEVILREREEKNEGPFLAGSHPTHADFCAFAFYALSLSNPCMVRNTWRHPGLPSVSRWLDDLLDCGLVSRDELIPENIDQAAVLEEAVFDQMSLRPQVS